MKKFTPQASLQAKYPTIAAEWDYSRNPQLPTEILELTPDAVSAKSNKKVWWRCSQGHQWQSKINNLARYGDVTKCRFCEPFRNRGKVAQKFLTDHGIELPEVEQYDESN